MMAAMSVIQIWRFPVKSLGGEQLEGVDVTELGIAGDRAWGILDHETGTVLTARREPRLLMASARLSDDGHPIVTLPDGTETDSSETISAWLGRDVALTRAADHIGVFENPKDFEHETDWVSWQGPAGAWHDAEWARVSLVSASSLRDLDPRRFRTNLVIGAGDENMLIGMSVALGTCRLDVLRGINRCIMVARSQPGLVADLDILRTIHRESNGRLAVGATVSQEGRVRVGDPLRTKTQGA